MRRIRQAKAYCCNFHDNTLTVYGIVAAMDRFAAIATFTLVAEEGGFSRAAAELGISKSVASRQIAALERELGGQLLERTTRTVSLTEKGRAYLERAKAILSELETADRAFAAPHNELAGLVRVAAPTAFGTSRLAGTAAAFMFRHPKITADIVLTDRPVDPDEEGFEVVLRIVPAEIDSPPLQQLGPVEMGLFAAPDYLSRHGRPQAPYDLAQHSGLVLGNHARQAIWHLRGNAGAVSILGRVTSNNAAVIREAAIAGLGIALLPTFVVMDDIKQGRLLRVLDGFEPKPASLCAEYPKNRALAARTRHFVEFLAERIRRDGA